MKLSLNNILKEFNSSEISVKILNNHGHKLVISSDDVSLGEEEQYHIQGSSDHDHVVEINVDSFEKLSRGETVELKSSMDKNHNHLIQIRSQPFRNDRPNPDQPRNAPIDPGLVRKKGY